jgi:hypothetical protein
MAAVVLAAVGAGMTASAARAHDEIRFGFGKVRVSVVTGGHTRACLFVPSHWETRSERVVVRDGYWRRVVEPSRFEIHWSWGARRFVRVCVRPESVSREWVPPVFAERLVEVFVPGRWDCRGHVDC